MQEVERVQEVGRRWGAAEAMELLSSAADDPFFTQLLSFVAEPNPVQAGALVITVYVRLQTGTCRIDGLQPSDNVRLIEEKTAAKSGVREGFRLYLNSKLLDSLSTLHESQVCNGAFIEMKMLGPGGMQLTTSQEEALSIAFSDEPEETEVKQLLASQTTWLDQHERCLKGSLKRGGSVAAGSSSDGGDGGGSGSGSGGGGAASGGSRTPDTPRRRCCDGEQSPTGWLKAAAKKAAKVAAGSGKAPAGNGKEPAAATVPQFSCGGCGSCPACGHYGFFESSSDDVEQTPPQAEGSSGSKGTGLPPQKPLPLNEVDGLSESDICRELKTFIERNAPAADSRRRRALLLVDKMDSEQKRAAWGILARSEKKAVTIVYGPAGTGKSWLVQLLLLVQYNEEEQVLALAAPTHGARRAGQRLVDAIYPRASFMPKVEYCTTHTQFGVGFQQAWDADAILAAIKSKDPYKAKARAFYEMKPWMTVHGERQAPMLVLDEGGQVRGCSLQPVARSM